VKVLTATSESLARKKLKTAGGEPDCTTIGFSAVARIIFFNGVSTHRVHYAVIKLTMDDDSWAPIGWWNSLALALILVLIVPKPPSS
jgi:hypothetical protein